MKTQIKISEIKKVKNLVNQAYDIAKKTFGDEPFTLWQLNAAMEDEVNWEFYHQTGEKYPLYSRIKRLRILFEAIACVKKLHTKRTVKEFFNEFKPSTCEMKDISTILVHYVSDQRMRWFDKRFMGYISQSGINPERLLTNEHNIPLLFNGDNWFRLYLESKPSHFEITSLLVWSKSRQNEEFFFRFCAGWCLGAKMYLLEKCPGFRTKKIVLHLLDDKSLRFPMELLWEVNSLTGSLRQLVLERVNAS